jgi:nitric oxide reductase NorQ protein
MKEGGTAGTTPPDRSTPQPSKELGIRCPICGFRPANRHGLLVHAAKYHGREEFLKIRRNMGNGSQTLNNFLGQAALVATVPEGVIYDDWCGYLPVLEKAYRAGLFTLIVGPKGTGKTSLVRKFAERVRKPLYTVNFSLRTRESHLVGATLLENGSTKFALGIIPKSMEEGALLYLDELNCAEPDVLIRLDEALDDRRELILKEAGELIRVRAHPEWYVIATVNPLSHAGTKELPPQLLSRFPVRLYLDYPPPEVEKRIARLYVPSCDGENLDLALKLAGKLREAAKTEDIQYSPSIRETIAFAKLVSAGVPGRQAAELVYVNAYYQWGSTEAQKIKDLVASLWGEKNA